MGMIPPFFRQITKFLLVAVLLQAVAPALAATKVKSAGNGSGWSEICTVLGTKWIKQSDSGSLEQHDEKSSKADHDSSEHCVFCFSTEALPLFKAPSYRYEHPTLVTFSPSKFLVARVFSGHVILSRAPPR